MQTNWIGRSTGVEIDFRAENGAPIPVFTTRPDTVYGVTFMVLAPEHPLVAELTTPDRQAAVQAYVEDARRQTEIERLSTEREKTGVFTGAYCINPLNGERVPIWTGDYVLYSYGTGAVMGVPAHDTRDFDFAKKYGLPIPVVIAPPGWDGGELSEAYTEYDGTMVNSGPFDGLPSKVGIERVIEYMEEKGIGKRRVNYRLRDWLISRQRYWGTPIPIVYCRDCGTVPVPEDQLPVLLPEDAEFRPTGESPLKLNHAFLHTTCPKCGGPAERETDTMDTFVDSSWYFLRYCSPYESERPWDPEKVKYWMPVDQYMGGAEHAVMHLLYARFFTKVLRDLGLLDFDEPFKRLFNQGIITKDGAKMSKSRGNVVNPDDYVASHGRRHRARLPDVHRPLGPGRRLERPGHQRRLPLHEPGVEPGGQGRRGGPACGRPRLRRPGRARPAPLHPQDDPARDRGHRALPLQHHAGGADGVHELPDGGAGHPGGQGTRLERGDRYAAAAAGAHGAAPGGGAVDAGRPPVQHPPAGVARRGTRRWPPRSR